MDTEVAIIGAGPHGLSAAVHLRRQNVSVHVFGEPMAFWRAMPEGMLLRSNLDATNLVEHEGPLSLALYRAAAGIELEYPVPLSTFIEYGLWVQREAVPDVDEREVTRLERTSGGYQLELADGERLLARRVVVAAGIAPFARIPPGFDHLPPGLVSHTSSHSDLAAFAGQRVAVVGGGQSAFESAALMCERGAEVEVLVRAPKVVWLRRVSPKNVIGPLGPIVYAPTDVGPLWYSRLVATPDLFRRLPRDLQNRIAYRSIRPACSNFVRVRLHALKLTTGVRVASASPADTGLRLALSDGSERQVDHLMLGTGYDVDVTRYRFLAPSILDDLRRVGGYPLLRRGLETSLPGLHMLGAPAAWSFGPTMRFVSGSWYAGKAVARAARTSRVSFRAPVAAPARAS
jgi:hypothetical protein